MEADLDPIRPPAKPLAPLRHSANQPWKEETSSIEQGSEGERGALPAPRLSQPPFPVDPGLPSSGPDASVPASDLPAGPKASGSPTDNRHSAAMPPGPCPGPNRELVCIMLPRARLKQHSCRHLPALLRTLGPRCRDLNGPEVGTGHCSTGRGRAGGAARRPGRHPPHKRAGSGGRDVPQATRPEGHSLGP